MADSPSVSKRGFLTTALGGSGTLDLGPLEMEFYQRLVTAGITIAANGTITFGVNPAGITISPAGSNTQVQFNDNGTTAGNAGLTFVKGTGTLTATNLAGAGAGITGVTVPIASGVSGLGTGVATALAVNVGSAGAPVINGGALGTPSSGALGSCTGLPISTGVSGLGTNVATALGVAVGSAGAPVVNGGALGTPSSGTLSSCTSLPISTGVSGLGANVATFLATPSSANLAAALTDETGSGVAVFGTSPALTTPTITSGTFATDVRGLVMQTIPGGRLTLTTGVPVTSADVTSAGTLYYTPYVGSTIPIYNGSAWIRYPFTERSLALTLTSGKNYDVFLYDNAGTLTLELSSAWTNDTTRADALVLQDGVYVKSGATTRRWLGTIRASGANTTEDSASKRFVWNAYNRVVRHVKVFDTTSNWSYATATWRQARATTTNQIAIVTGLASESIDLRVQVGWTSDAGANRGAVSFGEDSTTTVATNATYCSNFNNTTNQLESVEGFITTIPALGYHYYAWLEHGGGQTAVGAFFGTYSAAGGISVSGVTGMWVS